MALLKNDAIKVKEDDFGFGAEIQVNPKKVFQATEAEYPFSFSCCLLPKKMSI